MHVHAYVYVYVHVDVDVDVHAYVYVCVLCPSWQGVVRPYRSPAVHATRDETVCIYITVGIVISKSVFIAVMARYGEVVMPRRHRFIRKLAVIHVGVPRCGHSCKRSLAW